MIDTADVMTSEKGSKSKKTGAVGDSRGERGKGQNDDERDSRYRVDTCNQAPMVPNRV